MTNERKSKHAYVNESQSNMAKAQQRRSASGGVFSRAPVVTASSAAESAAAARDGRTDGRGRRGQGSVLALSSALAQAVWYNPEVQMGRVNIDGACLLVAGITSALRADRPWVNASCLNLPGQEPSQLIDLNVTLYRK